MTVIELKEALRYYPRDMKVTIFNEKTGVSNITEARQGYVFWENQEWREVNKDNEEVGEVVVFLR